MPHDINRRSAGRSMDASTNARHARFAAACAIEETVSEQPVSAVAEKWKGVGIMKGGDEAVASGRCPLCHVCTDGTCSR